jgi:hypothetical protein
VRLDQHTYECIFYDLRNNFLIFLVPNSISPASRRRRDCKKLNRDRKNPPLRGTLGRLCRASCICKCAMAWPTAFPTTSATDPTVGVRFRFWAPEAEKPDPNAVADRYGR